MPRKILVENECDRCKRTWLEPYVEGQVQTPARACEIKIVLVPADGKEQTVEFVSLCSSCITTLQAHVDAIGKKLQHKSPGRGAKKKEELVEAPPPSPTPTPQPTPPTSPAVTHTSSAGKLVTPNQSKPRSAQG